MSDAESLANWSGDPMGWLRLAERLWNHQAGMATMYANKWRLRTGKDDQNESLIAEMRRNPLWDRCWYSSDRTGMHIFIARE